VTMPFPLFHWKSVPQVFVAAAKYASGLPLNLTPSWPSLAHSRPVFWRISAHAESAYRLQ
jgi:hypothetical protein